MPYHDYEDPDEDYEEEDNDEWDGFVPAPVLDPQI